MDNCVYTQTLKIAEFVECFGVTLEYLPIEDKLVLRAVLSYWAYKMRHLDIKLTLRDALVYVTNNGSFDYQVNSNKAIDILEGITNRHLQKRMYRTPHPLTEDTSAREWLRDISEPPPCAGSPR